MSQLTEELDDLWNIVQDLLLFYHQCCTYCQPYDSGEVVWLSDHENIHNIVHELIEDVCRVNNYELETDLEYGTIAEAISEADISCPNCGVGWVPESEIGGTWLVADGEQTTQATYLLTKAYWPYLTHYTRSTDSLSGLDAAIKIIADGKIRASKKYVLGGYEVVSFTECSPLEIQALLQADEDNNFTKSKRGFNYGVGSRKESFRWDRSPHGIAIRRDVAIKAGVFPVLHGSEDLWKCLPEKERFRFVTFDRMTLEVYKDWTFEREFRKLGSVNLGDFNEDDVILIVGDRKEQFEILARRNVPPCPIMPFDYVFSRDEPRVRRTGRQLELTWGEYLMANKYSKSSN